MLERKILYFVTLIFVLIVNILYVDYEPFILLILLIIFPIVLLLLLKIQNNNCKIEISTLDKTIHHGETVKIYINLHHTFKIPISKVEFKLKSKYLNYEEEKIDSLDFGVEGNRMTRLSADFLPKYCGNVCIYVEEVRMFDYISLFKAKSRCTSRCFITVMPKLYEQAHNKDRASNRCFSDHVEYSKDRPGNDPSEVFDLREYEEGDNLSRIHWKLSSKSDKLVVKEYSCPMAKSEIILVELLANSSKESRPYIDKIYEAVYALGNYFCFYENLFQLVYYDKSIDQLTMTEIHNVKDLQSAVENMIQIKVYQEPYAWNSFCKSEFFENSRIHYIISKAYEKDNNIILLDENNIFLVDENNIQEIVDSFYLKV